MPLTLRQLLRDPDLGLTLLTPQASTTAEILWAHTSELLDPTPWLGGGELVMSLGLGLPTDPAAEDAYVRRLVDRGVVALALDTGIVLSDVPPGVVEAGARHGLPILRIPAATPFLAISRAILSALTADAVEAIKTVAAQQERVAAGAMRAGSRGVVESLAGILHAGVGIMDARGEVVEVAGVDADVLRSRVHQRLGPKLSLRRATSLVHVYPDLVLTIQAFVGEGADPQLLVLTAPEAFNAHQRLVVSHTVTLLSLLSRTPRRLASVEEHLRTAVARSLLVDGKSCDPTLADALGFESGGRVVVAHILGSSPEHAASVAARIVAELTGPSLRATVPQGEAIVAAGLVDLVPWLPSGIRSGCVGLSEPLPITDVGTGWRQAQAAARIARLQGRTVVEYAALAPVDALLLSHSAHVNAAFVESVLGPVLGYDARTGSELALTLEAYLANNGHADLTAKALQIHRHTLKQRLQRAQAILGQDLSSAVVRTNVWLALRARSVLQRAEDPNTVPVTAD